MLAIMRSIDLVLVEIMLSMLKSQENCLRQENQKMKKRLSLEIWLNQRKNCQKVGIQQILTLQRPEQSF